MNIEEIIKQVLETKGSAFFYTPPIYKNSKCYYFKSPKKLFSSASCGTLNSTITKFYNSITNSSWGYCLIDYEAGYCYEKRLQKQLKNNDKKIFQGFLFDEENIKTINPKNIKIDSV